MTGLQAARELSKRLPELKVLILSMHDNEQYFFEALRVGASGYVLKSAADRDLVEACRATMRGEPFIYPPAVRAIVRDYLERLARRRARGHRSADAEGDRGGQVDRRGPDQSRDRGRAGDQREDRRASPRQHPRKLGMRDRVELTRYAIRRGLVEA